MSRTGAYVAIALITALVTYFVTQMIGEFGAGRCDIHPQVSSKGMSALQSNAERARGAAYNAVLAEKRDRDAANRAAEDAGMQSFVYDLKDAIGAEYMRHRRAMDGCY